MYRIGICMYYVMCRPLRRAARPIRTVKGYDVTGVTWPCIMASNCTGQVYANKRRLLIKLYCKIGTRSYFITFETGLLCSR